MKKRYWRFMSEKKYYLEYIGLHHHRNVVIERWLNIFLAVISTGSVAAFFAWEKYAWIWGTIIILSQAVTAAKPYLPFYNRINELDKALIVFGSLYDKIEEKWYTIQNDNLSDEKINKLLYKYNKQWNKEDAKYLIKDSLPRKEKFVKQADDQANNYFELTFGGYENEE